MEFALEKDINEIFNLYSDVINAVNKTDIKLGWNIDIYPSYEFVKGAVDKNEMVVLRQDEKIVAAAVINHNMNEEYNAIDWKIKAPMEKISTIHALATLPSFRNKAASYTLLSDIEKHCKSQGDMAIHLDVIDTNIPAYKLYTRNGYEMIEQIKMYYEVVGTREFWMLEKVL